MGTIHHLLRAEEHLVLVLFADLGRYRENYDPLVLGDIRKRLAFRLGAQAETLLSQALLVDRLLTAGRAAPMEELIGSGEAPEEALRLLAIVEAAQSSRVRLEAKFAEDDAVDPGEVQLLVRFAALLLAAGLRLPRREAGAAARPIRPCLTLRPIDGRHAV